MQRVSGCAWHRPHASRDPKRKSFYRKGAKVKYYNIWFNASLKARIKYSEISVSRDLVVVSHDRRLIWATQILNSEVLISPLCQIKGLLLSKMLIAHLPRYVSMSCKLHCFQLKT